jgi:hypothetical protein
MPAAELPAIGLLAGVLPPLPAAAFAPAPPPLLAGVDEALMPALPALDPPAGAAVPPAGVLTTWFGCVPWLGVMASGVLLPHAEHASHARLANQSFAAMNGREICIELSRKQPASARRCRALGMPRQKSPERMRKRRTIRSIDRALTLDEYLHDLKQLASTIHDSDLFLNAKRMNPRDHPDHSCPPPLAASAPAACALSCS